MKVTREVEITMAPLLGSVFSPAIYNPICEAVEALLRAGRERTATRLVGAIVELMAKCRSEGGSDGD